jgi:hypothetical protein
MQKEMNQAFFSILPEGDKMIDLYRSQGCIIYGLDGETIQPERG